MKIAIAALLLAANATVVAADAPVVEDATARQSGESWTISVTLSHPDTGWDHYADGWEILTPSGESLGIRVLAHPHVNEQPFTRSKSGIKLPSDMTQVLIRARDNKDGWGEPTYTLDLTK